MSEKRELVRRLFAAVEARDAQAILDCYAEDIEIREAESLPYGGVYRGRDGAFEHWTNVAGAWAPFKTPELIALRPDFVDGPDDTVAVVFRARGVDAAGDVFDDAEVAVYRIAGGKIVRSQMFHADTAAVCEFLGREPGGTLGEDYSGAR